MGLRVTCNSKGISCAWWLCRLTVVLTIYYVLTIYMYLVGTYNSQDIRLVLLFFCSRLQLQ